jgi:hypothetical protein
LIDTHIAFCFWFQCRIKNDKEFDVYVEYQNQNENIMNLFNNKNENKIITTLVSKRNNDLSNTLKIINSKLNNNYSIILFTSYFQKPTDYISLYSIPAITAIGVPHKSHNATFYSPFAQIGHDILGHSNSVMDYLEFLYNQSNSNDI